MIDSSTFHQPHLVKKQEYFPKQMHYLEKIREIEQKIRHILLNSRDSSAMLLNIAAIVGDFFQVDICLIVAGTEKQNFNMSGLWAIEKNLNFTVEDFKELLYHPLIAEDRFLEPLTFCNLDTATVPFKSLMTISTSFQGNINGMIMLGKSQSHDWLVAEQELLKNVAQSVTIAFSLLELKEQNHTKTRYQNLINDLSKAISQNSDIDLILDLTLNRCMEALQLDRGAVLTLKYKNPLQYKRNNFQGVTAQIICHVQTNSLSSSESKNAAFNVSICPLLEQALKNSPEPFFLVSGVNEDLANDCSIIFPEAEVSALLFVPLTSSIGNDDKSSLVLGFLVLADNQTHHWQIEELNLINWIAIQLSTAIIHHQTLNRVQSLVHERTAQLKWSLDVQAKLSEKMRHQIEQLRHLNELKDDFLNSMSHELKTPLTSMKMAIKMLRQNGLPEETKEKYLNILEQEWNREFNLIKDLLTLQQIESEQFTLHPQELNLQQILDNLSKNFQKKWQPDKGLTVVVDYHSSPNHNSSFNLYTDSESLHHILEELLLNAGKYCDADTTIYIGATSQITLDKNQIAITVTNYGAGISAQELPFIFDKFRRGQGVTDRAVAGTGLGLALVKNLVQHLNGTIDVTSEPLPDNPDIFVTSFTFTLPQFKKQK